MESGLGIGPYIDDLGDGFFSTSSILHLLSQHRLPGLAQFRPAPAAPPNENPTTTASRYKTPFVSSSSFAKQISSPERQSRVRARRRVEKGSGGRGRGRGWVL